LIRAHHKGQWLSAGLQDLQQLPSELHTVFAFDAIDFGNSFKCDPGHRKTVRKGNGGFLQGGSERWNNLDPFDAGVL
jgi:hypothetical protein